MAVTVQDLCAALRNVKFNLGDEKALQQQLANRFTEKGISFKKEFVFDKSSIIDFLIDDIGVEVKIKGGKKAIYKQCLRYSTYSEVKQLLLITNVSMGVPEMLNDKPIYVFNLAVAWM